MDRSGECSTPGSVMTAGRCSVHYQKAWAGGDLGTPCIRNADCGGTAFGSGGRYLFCDACLDEGWERCAPCRLVYLRREQYRQSAKREDQRNVCRKCRTVKANRNRKRRALELRKALVKAQAGVCAWCFRPLLKDLSLLHVDHIIPRSAGGPNRRWNYQALHPDCNTEKGGIITEQARALAIEHGVLIQDIPIARRGRPVA